MFFRVDEHIRITSTRKIPFLPGIGFLVFYVFPAERLRT